MSWRKALRAKLLQYHEATYHERYFYDFIIPLN